jgi:hypothetical protein
VVVEIPTSGERIEARLFDDEGRLCLTLGKTTRASYVLKAVLEIGWRMVEATPEELALIESYGIAPNA